VTLDQDKVAETPTFPAPSALTVAAGGSVPLGIVINAVDSDDVILAISGVPAFESVSTAGVTPTVTRQGSTFTYTFNTLPEADWNNGLIPNSTFPRKGHPATPLTVTVSNTTAGESSTASVERITVTDPPAAGTFGTNDGSEFEISGPATLGDFYRNNIVGPPMVNDGTHAASLALLQCMAASFAQPNDGHGGTLISEPPPSQRQEFLTHPRDNADRGCRNSWF
jgi:hypothetical protein